MHVGRPEAVASQPGTPRSPVQETAFSAQLVPGMRFLVFEFAVCHCRAGLAMIIDLNGRRLQDSGALTAMKDADREMEIRYGSPHEDTRPSIP
eukprot:3925142-Rhodomonas_salina.3